MPVDRKAQPRAPDVARLREFRQALIDHRDSPLDRAIVQQLTEEAEREDRRILERAASGKATPTDAFRAACVRHGLIRATSVVERLINQVEREIALVTRKEE